MTVSEPNIKRKGDNNCHICAASRQLSSRVRMVGNDVGGKNKKFLSFIN